MPPIVTDRRPVTVTDADPTLDVEMSVAARLENLEIAFAHLARCVLGTAWADTRAHPLVADLLVRHPAPDYVQALQHRAEAKQILTAPTMDQEHR